MTDVLVDAEPLVTALDRADPLNKRIQEELAGRRGRIYTTWAAFTEAAHIVGRSDMRLGLIEMVQGGGLRLAELGHDDFPALAWFQKKYRNRNPDLAGSHIDRGGGAAEDSDAADL